MTRFAIYSDDEAGWWNNVEGWGGLETATWFTEAERAEFNLPMGGTWFELPTLSQAWHDLVCSADDEGCSDGLCVVDGVKMEILSNILTTTNCRLFEAAVDQRTRRETCEET